MNDFVIPWPRYGAQIEMRSVEGNRLLTENIITVTLRKGHLAPRPFVEGVSGTEDWGPGDCLRDSVLQVKPNLLDLNTVDGERLRSPESLSVYATGTPDEVIGCVKVTGSWGICRLPDPCYMVSDELLTCTVSLVTRRWCATKDDPGYNKGLYFAWNF